MNYKIMISTCLLCNFTGFAVNEYELLFDIAKVSGNERELPLADIESSLKEEDAISDRQMDELVAEFWGVSLPVSSYECVSGATAVFLHMAGRDYINGEKKIISIRRIPEEGLKISYYYIGSLENSFHKTAMLPLWIAWDYIYLKPIKSSKLVAAMKEFFGSGR